jgi:hypothetical protein
MDQMKNVKIGLLGIALLVSVCSHAQTCSNLPFGATTPGTISAAAQINRYCFTANVNDVMEFVLATSSGLSPKIQLFTSAGTPIGESNLAYCNGTALGWPGGGIKLPLSPNNVYEVWVSDCADTGTGTYDLYAQRVNNPGNSISAAFGTIESGSIALPAQSNTYTFTASAGDYFTFSMVANGSSPQLNLYAPDGTLFGESNLAYCNGSAMDWTPGVTVTKPGRYTLLVDACGAEATGTYSVYLQRTNNPGPPVTPILWDEVQAGSIAKAPGSGVYSFNGTANDMVTFNIAGSGFSPKFVLYYPDGTVFGSDNLAYCNGSTLQWDNIKLLKSGEYHLFVKDCSDTLIGTYNLSTQCFGACLQPASTLLTISPTSAEEGSGNVTLVVTGSSFLSTSVVEFNGAMLATTYVNSSKLTAVIPAADLKTPGTFLIRVFTPTPGGGLSNSLPFTVLGPVITSLAPSSDIAPGAGFTLTVTGAGFISTSVVRWVGTALPTTYVSSTELKATVAATHLTVAGLFPVTVANGTVVSPPVNFIVDNPLPGTMSLSPASIIVGGSTFALTVNGTGFVPGSVVEWKGTPLTTTFVNATKLTAVIPAADIVSGTDLITVHSVTPGGGTSGSLTFTINNPVPVGSSLVPANIAHGAASLTLTVNGYDFNEGAKVLWNGTALTTSFMSDTQLKAVVPAADLAVTGKATVTISNPAPTPSASNGLSFTIN